jgi:hypothetical protein
LRLGENNNQSKQVVTHGTCKDLRVGLSEKSSAALAALQVKNALPFLVVDQAPTTHLKLTRFEREKVMKRLLMIAGLVLTLSNVGLGIAYACECDDQYGGCSASGKGATCEHVPPTGVCRCTDGAPLEEGPAN